MFYAKNDDKLSLFHKSAKNYEWGLMICGGEDNEQGIGVEQ